MTAADGIRYLRQRVRSDRHTSDQITYLRRQVHGSAGHHDKDGARQQNQHKLKRIVIS